MDIERYRKHIIISQIGEKSQKLISNSSVLVIGAGGLGSAAIIYLAYNGIGKIGIVDYDIVEISNLNRQILYNYNDIGKKKISIINNKILKINPNIQVDTYDLKINSKNIKNILKKYDFIIDAVDNIETKLIINDNCVKLKKPFSYAGIDKFAGSTLTVIPEKSPCLRCIFKNIKKTPKNPGVFGPVPGILGTIQAAEALKYCGKFGNLLTNKILYINIFSMEFRYTNIKKSITCPICTGKS